jgi:Icc-related predicted phosphoesterase
VRLLLIADEEDPYLWDNYRPGNLKGIDMILSAGDLKSEYLRFLVTLSNKPLLYVHGNHDGAYDRDPPEGCECVDDRLVTVNGLRILGLGGSPRYNPGPYQYTERQMRQRIRRLSFRLRRAGGVDIVLTHAPARGYGDVDTPSHRGFEAFLPLLDRWKPRYLIHGHVHLRYQPLQETVLQRGDTTIINAGGKYYLDI